MKWLKSILVLSTLFTISCSNIPDYSIKEEAELDDEDDDVDGHSEEEVINDPFYHRNLVVEEDNIFIVPDHEFKDSTFIVNLDFNKEFDNYYDFNNQILLVNSEIQTRFLRIIKWTKSQMYKYDMKNMQFKFSLNEFPDFEINYDKEKIDFIYENDIEINKEYILSQTKLDFNFSHYKINRVVFDEPFLEHNNVKISLYIKGNVTNELIQLYLEKRRKQLDTIGHWIRTQRHSWTNIEFEGNIISKTHVFREKDIDTTSAFLKINNNFLFQSFIYNEVEQKTKLISRSTEISTFLNLSYSSPIGSLQWKENMNLYTRDALIAYYFYLNAFISH